MNYNNYFRILLFLLLFVFIPFGITGQDILKWNTVFVEPGLTWHSYNGFVDSQNASQIINVLELDLSEKYEVSIFFTDSRDSLSSVAEKQGAIAGINGTYELDASFIKAEGIVHSYVTLDVDHLRYWKHKGAFFIDNKTNNYKIEFGNMDTYSESGFPNIISGAPMLIDNYQHVGSSFTGDVSGMVLTDFEYEDYRRHQGVRHPRTAVALTDDNKLLLITVDGRRQGISEGMSAKELTELISNNFNPKSALNIDGGGSTTMWLSIQQGNGVVNFPTDNKVFDQTGQRTLRSFILVKRR